MPESGLYISLCLGPQGISQAFISLGAQVISQAFLSLSGTSRHFSLSLGPRGISLSLSGTSRHFSLSLWDLKAFLSLSGTSRHFSLSLGPRGISLSLWDLEAFLSLSGTVTSVTFASRHFPVLPPSRTETVSLRHRPTLGSFPAESLGTLEDLSGKTRYSGGPYRKD